MDDSITCRICLADELDRADVIAPCSCMGSSKFVHRECLDMWRTTQQDRAFSRCTECLTDFRLIPVHAEEDDPKVVRRRKLRYWLLMVRDLGGAFLMAQAIIIGMALIVYFTDDHHKHLITQFHMMSHPKVFYYLAGFILSSAIIGLVGVIGLCCSETAASSTSPGTCDCFYLGYACDGATCEGCNCSGCQCAAGSCDVGSMGPFALIIIAGFAVIGAIIVVMAGVYLVQNAIAKHASVLYKRGLAQEFAVADLDSPDLGLSQIRREASRSEGPAEEGEPHSSLGQGGIGRIEMSPLYHPVDLGAGHGSNSSHHMEDRERPAIGSPRPSAPIAAMCDDNGGDACEAGAGVPPSAPELTHAQRAELARNGLI